MPSLIWSSDSTPDSRGVGAGAPVPVLADGASGPPGVGLSGAVGLCCVDMARPRDIFSIRHGGTSVCQGRIGFPGGCNSTFHLMPPGHHNVPASGDSSPLAAPAFQVNHTRCISFIRIMPTCRHMTTGSIGPIFLFCRNIPKKDPFRCRRTATFWPVFPLAQPLRNAYAPVYKQVFDAGPSVALQPVRPVPAATTPERFTQIQRETLPMLKSFMQPGTSSNSRIDSFRSVQSGYPSI